MVKQLYRAIASKYDVELVFSNPNVNFYRIVDGIAIPEQQPILNMQLHNAILESTGKNVYAFYADSSNLQASEDNLTFAFGLGIRENLLPNDMNSITLFTEMIVLHELAHLIDQQNLIDQLGIVLNDCDKKIGFFIAERAAYIDEDLTHNNVFGAILNHLIYRNNQIDPHYSLRLAMSKTLLDIEQAIIDNEIDDSVYQCQN